MWKHEPITLCMLCHEREWFCVSIGQLRNVRLCFPCWAVYWLGKHENRESPSTSEA